MPTDAFPPFAFECLIRAVQFLAEEVERLSAEKR